MSRSAPGVGASRTPPGRGPVVVEIAVKDDPRLLAAIDSLAAQTRRPDRVLIAGSPKTPDDLAAAATSRQASLRVELARLEGGPVDARVKAMGMLREPTTVFLDSDEVAPPEWLERIVAPIEDGRAVYCGGPTRPLRPPTHPIQRYMEMIEESIYDDLVPRNIAYLPLGNTAWSTAVLQRYGFDQRVTAEDHDLETRVLADGLPALYLPEAWVFHDKSLETSYRRWAQKRYVWLFQMAVSLLKNGKMRDRWQERRRPIPHPLWYVEQAMKPIALVHARLHWSEVSVHGMRSDAKLRPP